MAKCMLICAISSWLLFTTAQTQTPSQETVPECLEISTFHEAANNITSPNYPQPYPTGCTWEWTVNATGKSRLHITLHSFDVDNEINDQLSVQVFEGEKEIDTKVIIDEGREVTINWDDKGGHSLVEFVFKVVKRNETNGHTGFNLYYELSSNESTADEVEYHAENVSTGTGTDYKKELPANVRDETVSIRGFIMINLNGKAESEFSEEKDNFTQFMADLATTFCKTQNISGTPISPSSVSINSIVACSKEWPESELCISINLSITVNSITNELTTPHLYDVWALHSAEKLQSELGVKEYIIKEDNNFVLIIWLATTGVLFLLFLAILGVILRTRIVENYIKRTRREHLSGYGVYERSRFAQPNQQQLVPPFFYPDERIVIDQKQQYGVEPLHKNIVVGQENPAFEPDSVKRTATKQMSQETIDDFDSDDDTIYPPSPLTRQSSNKPQLAIPNKSIYESETAF